MKIYPFKLLYFLSSIFGLWVSISVLSYLIPASKSKFPIDFSTFVKIALFVVSVSYIRLLYGIEVMAPVATVVLYIEPLQFLTLVSSPTVTKLSATSKEFLRVVPQIDVFKWFVIDVICPLFLKFVLIGWSTLE